MLFDLRQTAHTHCHNITVHTPITCQQYSPTICYSPRVTLGLPSQGLSILTPPTHIRQAGRTLLFQPLLSVLRDCLLPFPLWHRLARAGVGPGLSHHLLGPSTRLASWPISKSAIQRSRCVCVVGGWGMGREGTEGPSCLSPTYLSPSLHPWETEVQGFVTGSRSCRQRLEQGLLAATSASTHCAVMSMGSDVTGWPMSNFMLLCQQWGREWLGIRGGNKEVTKYRKTEAQSGSSVPYPSLP